MASANKVASAPSGGDGAFKMSSAQTLLSGGVAGCASRTFTAPLDVTKILFQCQSDSGDKAAYNSFGGALKKIYEEEGLKGLWKGNNVACLRLGPYSAMKYWTFETIRTAFSDENGNCAGGRKAVAGAVAGVSAVVTTYPLDLIKTRLTLQKEGVAADGSVMEKTYTGIVDCAVKISKQEGVTSLYKGMSTTIQGVIPFEACQFWFYNMVREMREEQLAQEGKKMGSSDFLILGCVSGAVSQTFAYPFDLIRKRLMAQSKAKGMLAEKYTGTADAFKKIIAEEGFFGLYKGTVPNLLKVCPYAAIMWASYEQMKIMCEWYSTGRQ